MHFYTKCVRILRSKRHPINKTFKAVMNSHLNKLSYRRESAHLKLLYRKMQKALRYVKPFKGVHSNYRQC